MKHVVTVHLTDESIKKAIDDVKEYRNDLVRKSSTLIEKLVQRGVEIAKEQIVSLGAFDDGELLQSIQGLMYTDGKRGIIFSDCNHAVYVEFGTGVVGERSPHPTLPWEYDIHGHGESGWVYYDDSDGKFHWTKGMSSRPFMHNTISLLQKELDEIARGVFK